MWGLPATVPRSWYKGSNIACYYLYMQCRRVRHWLISFHWADGSPLFEPVYCDDTQLEYANTLVWWFVVCGILHTTSSQDTQSVHAILQDNHEKRHPCRYSPPRMSYSFVAICSGQFDILATTWGYTKKRVRHGQHTKVHRITVSRIFPSMNWMRKRLSYAKS